MNFSSFASSSSDARHVIIAPGLSRSSLFTFFGNNRIKRTTVSSSQSQTAPEAPEGAALFPWLTQTELITKVVAQELAGSSKSLVTIALPAHACRVVSLPFCFNRTVQGDRIEERELRNAFYTLFQEAREILRQQLLRERMPLHSSYAAARTEGVDFTLIDAVLGNLKIDGFRIHNPIGLRGSVIEGRLTAIFAAHETELLHERLASALPGIPIARTAFAAALNSSFASLFAQERIAAAIFFNEDGTDILIYEEGALRAVYSMSLGQNIFTAAIARAFALPYEEAERALFAHTNNYLSRGMSVRLSKVIAEPTRQWCAALSELFSEKIREEEGVPTRLVFCGSVHIPRDVRVALGLSLPNARSSRTLVAPETFLSSMSATAKEVLEKPLPSLMHQWILTQGNLYRPGAIPELRLKVSSIPQLI